MPKLKRGSAKGKERRLKPSRLPNGNMVAKKTNKKSKKT